MNFFSNQKNTFRLPVELSLFKSDCSTSASKNVNKWMGRDLNY